MLFPYNQLFQWTYNNHLTCGFHKESFGDVDKNMFFSKVGSISRTVYTAFEEAQIAAALIYKEAKQIGKNIVLCLSGGIDSEAMLRAFMSSSVPFQAVIMRFNDNLNFFDIETIIPFCNKNHIDYKIFDLDILDFFESGKYLYYGQMYQCQSPQLAAHLYLCDHIKGCPVLSWQPPEIFFHVDSKNKTQQFSFGLPGQLHSVLLRYFIKKQKFGVPFFFLYTPELLSAFFQLPFLQKMIWFGRKGKDVRYSYKTKCMSYKQSGFSIKPRNNKYTGFERVRYHYDLLDKKFYGMAFDDRYRTPLKKLNPLPKNNYQIVPRDVLSHSQETQELDKMYKNKFFQLRSDSNAVLEKE